jgi:tetratricopeptide (TPR) repeat protein
MVDRIQESLEATRLAQRAVCLGTDGPVALCMSGYALAFIAHEFDDATVLMDRGLAVNPNFATGWNLGAWLRVWRGEPDLALEHVAHATRLSPLDSSMLGMQGPTAYAYFLAGHYDAAWSWAKKAMRENPNFILAICNFAASSALAGQLKQAQRVMERIQERDARLRLSNLKDLTPFRRSKDLAALAEGLRKAGLPE